MLLAPSSNLGTASQGGGLTYPLDYPFAVSADLFPSPTVLNSTGSTSLVQLISLSSPTAPSAFGLLNVSGNATGPDGLWYSVGGYSAVAAEMILKGAPCISGSKSAGDCVVTPTVPVLWSSPALVAASSSGVTADALAASGTAVYAAATSDGTTTLYDSTDGGAAWSTFASGLTGAAEALLLNATDIVAVTRSGTAFLTYEVGLSGGAGRSSSAFYVTGSGVTGVVAASATVVPVGGGWRFVVAAGVTGPDQVEVATSSNGLSFSPFTVIASYNASVPNSALSSLGATRLYPSGGVPGQVALAPDGSGVLLLFTSRVAGQASAFTMVAGSGGSDWQGPYPVAAGAGSVQDPGLASSPGGDVYATWRDVANGTGTTVETVLAPTAAVIEAPTALPGSSLSGLSPTGAPAIAVDGFQRPLIAWPAVNGIAPSSGLLAYSGGFLTATTATDEVNQIVTDPLSASDFVPGAPGGSSPQSVLIASTSTDVNSIDTQLSSAEGGSTSGYCNAQNLTVLELYANLTRVPLSYDATTGTTCASFSFLQLHPTMSYLDPTLGPQAANTYLATYADWALEAEGVALTASPLAAAAAATQPAQSGMIESPTAFSPPAPTAPASKTVQGGTETVTITPTIYSPTALDLSISATPLPTYTSASVLEYCYTYIDRRLEKTGGVNENFYTSAAKTWVNVSLNNGTVTPFTGTTSFPSGIFLTNLTPVNRGSPADYWKAVFSIAFHETVTYSVYGTNCPSEPKGPQPVTPSSPASLGPILTNGTFWTELAVDPYAGPETFVTSSSTGSCHAYPCYSPINVSWTNTIASLDTLTLANVTTYIDGQSASTSTYAATGESWTSLAPLALGDTYTVTVAATSRSGGWSSAQEPADSVGSMGSTSPETGSTTCTFTLNPPSETIVSGSGATSNVTATTATIMWSATGSVAGAGFVTYYAVGTGRNFTDDQVNASGSGGTFHYVAQLHGLSPWTGYSVSVGIAAYPTGSSQTGCYTIVQTDSLPTFTTAYEFPLYEQDRPYDSISRQGGGAVFQWSLPWSFLSMDPTWVSGSLTYSDTNGTMVTPVSPTIDYQGTGVGFSVELMLYPPNTTFTANVSLNYRVGSTSYNASSPPLTFVYLRDTTGDGLTDAEKLYGWTVTYTTTGGSTVNQAVSANPDLFASNGLVNDYVEKQFGLNPTTVDTAGSHMLDTWNLTFDLGSAGSATLPTSGFHYWFENGSNPFAELAGASPPVADRNLTNLTPLPSRGFLSGDSSPWASTALWKSSALQGFENLSAVRTAGWLRAVTGTWNGLRTLTVWGKLSWGANPLAAS